MITARQMKAMLTHERVVAAPNQGQQKGEGDKKAFTSLEKSWLGNSSFAPMRNAEDIEDLTELELRWLGHVDPQ